MGDIWHITHLPFTKSSDGFVLHVFSQLEWILVFIDSLTHQFSEKLIKGWINFWLHTLCNGML